MAKQKSVPPADPVLTPEQARSVLQANVRNIVKKAAAGQTLTKLELELLRNFETGEAAPVPPTGEWVSSYEKLGAALGLHRASFPRIRKDHPDAPKPRANGDHNLPAWTAFLEANPQIKPRTEPEPQSEPAAGPLPAAGSSKSALQLEELRQKVRRLIFKADQEEALYLLKAGVHAWQVEAIERIKETLSVKLKNELPPKLVGLSAPEISLRMDPVIAECCRALKSLPEP